MQLVVVDPFTTTEATVDHRVVALRLIPTLVVLVERDATPRLRQPLSMPGQTLDPVVVPVVGMKHLPQLRNLVFPVMVDQVWSSSLTRITFRLV
jgi:hypothetical protein